MAQTDGTPTIFIVNRFYYPDHSATAQIASDLGAHLAQNGWTVRAVSSRYRYDGGAPMVPHESVAGVAIRRLRTTGFGRSHKLGRLIDYVSFYLLACVHILLAAKRGDVVICKTDPPLLSMGIAIVCRIRGARMINWLQDLFPEVAVTMLPRPVFTLLAWVRNRSLRSAKHNVVIGTMMAARVQAAGVEVNGISCIPNWTDEDIAPINVADNQLRRSWGFDAQDFVVSYSGNLGFAHDYRTLLDAAAQIDGKYRIHFVMIGGGGGFTALHAEVTQRGLSNFHFRPYQPRCDLSHSLCAGDLHWFSLKPEMEGLIVPSKLYGIIAAGRPFIFVGDTDGEVGQFIARHGAGYAVAIGDTAALARLLEQLAQNRKQLAMVGQQALAASNDYRRASALTRWHQVITSIAEDALQRR